MQSSIIGIQCLLELYGCSSARLDEGGRMDEAIRRAARLSGLSLVHVAARALPPHGNCTIAIFLEGHLCVRSWPRNGTVAADLFSARQYCQPLAACRSLIFDLDARQYVLTLMERQLTAPGRPTVRLLTRPLSVMGKRKEVQLCAF